MTDLLKGLTGGGWASLFAWILPSAVAIALFWVLAAPQMDSFPTIDAIKGLSEGALAASFVGASAVLGLLLDATSTPLYRILEGYFLWPKWLQDRRRRVHAGKRQRLVEKLTGKGWEYGLVLERLARYPDDAAEITPTRLGNAIRAFEMYGKSRFNLDSQTLWNELNAVVPKALQVELDRSRALVDFFIAGFYLALLLGLVTGCYWVVHRQSLGLLAFAMVAFLSMAIWYELAITSTSYWSSTVQALVNLGRVGLAEQLGLDIPLELDAERAMWGNLTSFVYFGDLESGRKLDPYRRPRPVSPAGKNGGSQTNGDGPGEDGDDGND